MFGDLGLRTKLLLPLLVLVILPLLITILVFSHLNQRQIGRAMALRQTDIANYIERNTTYSQLERFNYLKLLAGSEALVAGANAMVASGSSDLLRLGIEELSQSFRFDILEVLSPQGELLLRTARDATIPASSGKEHPIIQASLEGDPYYDVSEFDGRLAIVAACPIRSGDAVVAHLVGVTLFSDKFAHVVKSGSNADIAFYHGTQIVAATHQALRGIDLEEIRREHRESLTIEDRSYALFINSLSGKNAGVIIALDQSELVAAIRTTRTILWALLAVVGALAGVVGFILAERISRPLKQVVGNLREIAEGDADLTRELEVQSRDEVGELAGNFNRFVARLREMVERTRSVSGGLNEAVDRIRSSSREVNDGAVRQSQSLEESFRAMQGIEEPVSGIAESTGTLVDSAEESSSATLELGATIEEIASQMEKLFAVVDEVSSSINEMSVASQQVTENVEILSSSTEVTASSITELDASIKEIEENAEKTSRLSEEAARDAQQGKETVDETIRGIGAIREMVDRASGAIQELGSQSSAIGKILTVIDDVADQTSLLALNAAIIAAQAGEHGKGFAVVADEIRELAERTAVSTREIAAIIGSLQSGTEEAVRAMAAGSERVHQEVERSKAAGAALEKIRNSTLKSTEQVSGIVRATQEQARGSRQITNSINQVASMLGQIAAAIKQQTEGARQLARAAESMKEIASQVKHSTGEQAKGSRQINASMEKIRTMIERIDEATREQTQRSRQVLEAVSSIRVISENTASRTAELDQVVETLTRQTATLEDEVGAFKV